MIAIAAGRDNILPGCLPVARAGQHVVDRQLRAAWLNPTVLAGLTVTRKHAAARAGQPQSARNLDVAHQADDERDIEEQALRAQTLFGRLDHLCFFLKQEYDRAPSRDELERLVASVENQDTLPQQEPPFQSRT